VRKRGGRVKTERKRTRDRSNEVKTQRRRVFRMYERNHNGEEEEGHKRGTIM